MSDRCVHKSLSQTFQTHAVKGMVDEWLERLPRDLPLDRVVSIFAQFVLVDDWRFEIVPGGFSLSRTERWDWTVTRLSAASASAIQGLVRCHLRTPLFSRASIDRGAPRLSGFAHDALLNDDRLRCRVAEVWIQSMMALPVRPRVRAELRALVLREIAALRATSVLRAAPLGRLQSALSDVDVEADSPTRSETLSSSTS